MRPQTRLFLAAFLAAMFVQVAPAVAGAIKSWSSGETLTSADLNANFAHIHSLMVGGHGGRLVNADVSASASISSSKLAGGLGIAKSHVTVADACTSSPCTMVNAYNVSGITRSSQGVYVVTAPYTIAGNAILVTANSGATTPNLEVCNVTYSVGTTFTVQCFDASDGSVEDSGFSIVVFNTSP